MQTIPCSPLDSSSERSILLDSIQVLDNHRLDDLMRFSLAPSPLLCDYYKFLIQQRCEENLELLLCIRNHFLLYRAFKRHNLDVIPEEFDSKITQKPKYQIDPSLLDREPNRMVTGLDDLVNGTVEDIGVVNYQILDQSAWFIYNTFLNNDAVKQVKLLPDKYSNLIFNQLVDECSALVRQNKCCKLFREIRNEILNSLQDSFQQFLNAEGSTVGEMDTTDYSNITRTWSPVQSDMSAGTFIINS